MTGPARTTAPGDRPVGPAARAVVADVAARLAAAGIGTPEVDARWLVAAAAGFDPRRAPDRVLPPAATGTLELLVARRAAREPLQLVVGTTAFRTLTLVCAPGVFVPRPETEVLAGLAIDTARAAVAARGSALVVEPCCGTGAVALAVATEVPSARVVAGDVSPAAVALAHRNRAALGARVEVRAGHLLDVLTAEEHGHVDVIVANPPYLPEQDLADLAPEVADHDPHAALFGGPDGHEVVGALLEAAVTALSPGGVVLLEVDARRGGDAVARALRAGLVDVRPYADLTGAMRFIAARRPGRPPSEG